MQTEARFRATVEWTSGAPMQARARNHALVIDEPAALGGTDKGPTPVEYVLMGLGGCVAFVGKIVAKEMGINIKRIRVSLSGGLNPARFRGEQTDDRAGFKQIDVEVEVESDAPRPQLEQWLRTVESRCPVGDNIQNPTPVVFSLK